MIIYRDLSMRLLTDGVFGCLSVKACLMKPKTGIIQHL